MRICNTRIFTFDLQALGARSIIRLSILVLYLNV